MTVASVYVPAQYAGNGVTTSFAFPYNFFAPSDLVVSLFNTSTNAPVAPAPVLNGAGTYDYTVTGSQDADTGEYLSGGSVVFNTALPSNYTVTIALAVSPTQNVSLTNNAPFPAKTLEAALDRAMLVIQEALRVVASAINAPASDPPGQTLTLPPASVRANQMLGFDGTGQPIVAQPSSALISAAMQPVVDAATTTIALESLGFASAVLAALLETTTAAVLAALGGAPAAGNAAQTFAVANAAAANEAVALGQADARYAALAGLSTQAFNVANAATATEAVALGQSLAGATAQDLTASRAIGTVYTNSTNRMIIALVTVTATAASQVTGSLAGFAPWAFYMPASGDTASVVLAVPPGATYEVGYVTALPTLTKWVETR